MERNKIVETLEKRDIQTGGVREETYYQLQNHTLSLGELYSRRTGIPRVPGGAKEKRNKKKWAPWSD